MVKHGCAGLLSSLLVAAAAFAQPGPDAASASTVAPASTTPPVPIPVSAVRARRAHAPIAVAIVVDQLASWVLRERIDRLDPKGGFARLRAEGKYFPEVAFAHAVTETAPGHASLFTGRTPREHGIVANDVLGSDGRLRSLLADDNAASQRVALDGDPLPGEGVSLEPLESRSSLVAASFRSRYPKGSGIIASLSLKERAALLAAGDNADYVLWFDPALRGGAGEKEVGGFVTSKRYQAGVAKGGLASFVAGYLQTEASDGRGGIARIEEQTWTGLDPAWLSENAGIPGDSDYTGFVFAHTASRARKPGAAFRALPEADRLLLEMALRIIKAEPWNQPVFLAVSLSANDYAGHLFGPDSWEAWDGLRRLDAALAWFFRQLDELGPEAWAVVLSADHGIVPVEDSRRRPACGTSRKAALEAAAPCSGASERGARVHVEDLRREAENAARKAGLRDAQGARLDPIIAGVAPPYIYLTDAARTALAKDAAARRRLASRLDGELRRRFKALDAVLDVARFKDESVCPDERADPVLSLVCNSVSPASDRGGDFYFVLGPGSFIDPGLVRGAGSEHGSPYGYDRIVPLLVRDPSRPELAGQIHEGRTPFTQFRDELVRIILGVPAAPR
jgi:hypothetical protein